MAGVCSGPGICTRESCLVADGLGLLGAIAGSTEGLDIVNAIAAAKGQRDDVRTSSAWVLRYCWPAFFILSRFPLR